MKALLLAAGLGTRLRPITNDIPKCLVPIMGRPLLEYWFELLSEAGVDIFYINLHYHAQAVRDFVAGSPYSDRVIFLEEEELLGTGGTLKRNADLFLGQDFFLCHADNLCLTDFRAFFDGHALRPREAAFSMMTFRTTDPRSCGIVELDERKLVRAFHEKVSNPPSDLANGAVFLMSPEVAKYSKTVPKDVFEISLEIIPAFMGRIWSWENKDYHLDIGTLTSYNKAQGDRLLLQNLLKRYGRNELYFQ